MEQDHSEWRQWLAEKHHAATQDYDKAVMTLSGGALGLSLAFVKDIAPDPKQTWALIGAWAWFAGSLLFIFISLLTSQSSILNNIKGIDERKENVTGGFAGWITVGLNTAAAVGFVVGVGFLVAFAALNI